MQLKPLIIVIVVAMVLLLSFNIINGNRHENNRAATENTETIADTTNTIASTAADSDDGKNKNNNITSKPLGEQPKAIMDKATTQIDSAQQADNARLAQMDSTQQ